MYIRTNPMKAVPTLLKRLGTVEHQANLKDLKSTMINIQNLFSKVKKNEDELLDTLTIMDGYLRKSNVRKLMEEEKDICNKIRDSTRKLLPIDEIQGTNIFVAQSPLPAKTFQDVKLDKREVEIALSSSIQHEDLHLFEVNFKNLDHLQKRCFFSRLDFPENAIMKKRNIILWWVGGNFIKMRTEEENGEDVFDKLLDYKLIVPHGNDKYTVESKFKINPLVHDKSVRSLFQNDIEQNFGIYSQIVTSSHHDDTQYGSLALDKKKVNLSDGFRFKSDHCKGVFNVGASYLNFGPRWDANMKHLEVLQLGRWLHDSSIHHIEVQSEEFLKQLRDQKELKYLSLRGISRISQLPPSVFELESLQFLDLKACHNLETLPNDISSLRNLIHLNFSRCYLLDRMPEGIEKLTKLEVLKGFLVGSSIKTPCKITDLARLLKLKQLNIHIGSWVVIQEWEFQSLQGFSKLEKLEISWGVVDTRYGDIQVTLSSNLKKLHLEGFPGQNIPEWLKPIKLNSSLCELFITGGKLKSMDPEGYAHKECCAKANASASIMSGPLYRPASESRSLGNRLWISDSRRTKLLSLTYQTPPAPGYGDSHYKTTNIPFRIKGGQREEIREFFGSLRFQTRTLAPTVG
ncbi:Disease resistance RPP13-like protein 4, partial [Mucuna pruriens]